MNAEKIYEDDKFVIRKDVKDNKLWIYVNQKTHEGKEYTPLGYMLGYNSLSLDIK